MIVAQLVLSELARMHLAAAGITTGWLTAWLQSAGAARVDILTLEGGLWKDAPGWQVFVGGESELMRVALRHGRRIQVQKDGRRTLIGASAMQFCNPDRLAWHYRRDGENSHTVLLPVGDIAYQRQLWLAPLLQGNPCLPLHVCLGEEGGIVLEPGLCAYIARGDSFLPAGQIEFNDGGYLPEEQLAAELSRHGLRVRFAESCTGGGMGERLSRLPGASNVLDGGWISYSNQAKSSMLGVPAQLIAEYGAVSRAVVEAMAEVGSDSKHACAAVSGIAGPEGGGKGKPVGSVWIAVAVPGAGIHAKKHRFVGSRADIRAKSVITAFYMLIQSVKKLCC